MWKKVESNNYIFNYLEGSVAEKEIVDCNVSYPIMGAFTEYLILCYGIKKYKEFYSFQKVKEGFMKVFGQDIEILEKEFREYINLFGISDELLHLLRSLK